MTVETKLVSPGEQAEIGRLRSHARTLAELAVLARRTAGPMAWLLYNQQEERQLAEACDFLGWQDMTAIPFWAVEKIMRAKP